jgi:hypothetical protein
MSMKTYQNVSLPAIHESIHNLNYFHPQIYHSIPSRQENQALQEDFAKKGCRLYSHLTHAVSVGQEYFRFKQSQDQREKDFTENGSPFLVLAANQIWGQ